MPENLCWWREPSEAKTRQWNDRSFFGINPKHGWMTKSPNLYGKTAKTYNVKSARINDNQCMVYECIRYTRKINITVLLTKFIDNVIGMVSYGNLVARNVGGWMWSRKAEPSPCGPCPWWISLATESPGGCRQTSAWVTDVSWWWLNVLTNHSKPST